MKGTEIRKDPGIGDMLEELFRHASVRERAPESDETAIREALHAQWRELSGRRRRRRNRLVLGAAASVILAIFAGSQLLQGPAPPASPVTVASIEKSIGSVTVRDLGGGPARMVRMPAAVVTGQVINTHTASRLAIRWQDGTSVRMDQNSEVSFTAPGEIELVSGRLYVDTQGADGAAKRLTVLTPAGRVSHLGTQYMAAVDDGNTRLSVREGRVVLNAEGREELAGKGQQLMITAAGVQTREAIPGYGERWQWTEALAPSFSSDGRSLSDFLAWVGRESGRTVEFASREAEQLATTTLLRGEIELEPTRALAVMLQTTDLVAQVRDGAIVVELRSAN